MPAISQASGPAQSRLAVAADPNGECTKRLGLKMDIAESIELALELRLLLGPELAEYLDILVADRTPVVEGSRTQRLELLSHPTCPYAHNQPVAAREAVYRD